MTDVLDDLLGEAKTAKPAVEPEPGFVDWSKSDTLYVDIETIPDDSRAELFGLEPVPSMPERLPIEQCGPVETVRDHDIGGVKAWLSHNNPCDEFLETLRVAEQADKKPRKGVLDAIDGYVESLAKIAGAADERRKLLSVTPEFCRICAIGFGSSRGETETHVLGEESADEAWMLGRFWALLDLFKIRQIVGFNVINFDLPTIFIRSAILGVEPTRRIDLSPWKGEVVDLMARRWPKGGQRRMKDWARMLGIEVPAGDCDGSQVAELFATNPAKLREYLASDIEVTRRLHTGLSGYFW